MSWALGIGRCGAILGSLMGGALLGAGLGFSAIIMLLALPALLASIAMFAMPARYSRDAGSGATLAPSTRLSATD